MYNRQSIKRSKFLTRERQWLSKYNQLENQVRSTLFFKYANDEKSYVKKIINDIIYNEKSHIVAVFKDFLIYDDLSEFLKRFYKLQESYVRLPKFFEYYENSSRIFPNYIALHEAKYIFKNIQKKQRMIDNQQLMEMKQQDSEENEKLESQSEDKIFDTEVYNSIMNQTVGKDEDLRYYFQNNNHNSPSYTKENSVYSINKLIDLLDDAEKSIDKHQAITNRESITPMMKLLTPTLNRPSIKEKMKEKVKENNNSPVMDSRRDYMPKFDKKNLKTIEVSRIIKEGNPTILNEKNNMFENNILSQKCRDIKVRKQISNDFGNVTAVRDKLIGDTKKELNLNLHKMNANANVISSTLARELKKSCNDKPPESDRIKSVQLINGTHKYTLSMPKLTNNIFYIINQNPHASTHITIFNNGVIDTNQVNAQEVNNSTLLLKKNNPKDVSPQKIHTAREKKDVINNKSNLIFQLNEKKTFQKVESLKQDILSMITKNKKLNTISHSNNIRKDIPATMNPNPSNKKSVHVNDRDKDDLRTSGTSFNQKQMERTQSLLNGNNHPTIQQDPRREVSPIVPHSTIKGNNYLQHLNKVKFDCKAKKQFQKTELNNNKYSSIPKKASLSPKDNFCKINNINELKSHRIISKTRPTIIEMKNPNGEISPGKAKENNEVNIITPSNNGISHLIKGFQIKNFHEAVKQGNYVPNNNSDRLQAGKRLKMNK